MEPNVNDVHHNKETKRRVHFAIFGMGRAGSIHFGNLTRNPRGVVRYVVEENRGRAEQVMADVHLNLADCYGECRILNVAESNKVYEDDSVDAIIVCSHTHTHEEIVQRSLQSDKFVFCEKPISKELSATKACYDIAEERGRLLFCAFNRRFDPSVRQLQRRVRNGEVGQVQCIKTCSRDCPLPSLEYLKMSGGMFHDCSVHDIDLICWILNEYPDVVYAQGHTFHKELVEMNDLDQVNITMKFPSGVIGTIDLSREASYGYDQRIEVFGSGGMLETRNRSHQLNIVGHLGKSGSSTEPMAHSFPQRYAEAYAGELDYFIDYVLGIDDHIEVSRTDTVMATIIAEACEQSYRKGAPVNTKELCADELSLCPGVGTHSSFGTLAPSAVPSFGGLTFFGGLSLGSAGTMAPKRTGVGTHSTFGTPAPSAVPSFSGVLPTGAGSFSFGSAGTMGPKRTSRLTLYNRQTRRR